MISNLKKYVNSVIEQYLRCYANFRDSDWSKYLFLYKRTIKHSPFFVNYCYNPRHSPAIPSSLNIFQNLPKNLKEESKKQEQFANKHRSEAPNFKLIKKFNEN
ncbi:hypothetical protein H8356DRAFT_1338017 [Neocallimastix lanati (nom. inval.)]|nr:hypothetical protein H8356DRAFT_1338017 [Neocallimastix sp. JGI-2020a]